MKPSSVKPEEKVDDTFQQGTCFSFLSFFSKNKSTKKNQSQHQLKDTKQNEKYEEVGPQPLHQKVTLLTFPEIKTKYIDVEFEKIQSLTDLCEDGDIIGIVGMPQPTEINFSDLNQVICISPKSQIKNLALIRPYSFSRIFVTNGFQEYSLSTLFDIEQILTLKLKSKESLIDTIAKWERQILKDHGQDILRDMVSKLSLKISIKNNCYWVSFNELVMNEHAKDAMKSYYWGNIGLKIQQDEELVERVYEQMTLKKLFQLIELKNELPQNEKINKNTIINFLQNNKPRFESKMSQVFSSSSPDNSLKSSKMKRFISKGNTQSKKQDRLSNISSSDIDIYVPLKEDLIVEREIDYSQYYPLERKLRCYSADLSEQALKESIQKKTNILWEQIYQKY